MMIQKVRSLFNTPLMALGLAALLFCATGCPPKDAPPPAGAATELYKAGNYAAAREAGRQQMNTGRSQGLGLEGQYIAGLSSYQLGDYSQCVQLLTPLVRNHNAPLAGSASVTTGLAYKQMGLPTLAQGYLSQGAGKLEGEEKARAYYELGILEHEIGLYDQAVNHLKLAMGSSKNEKLRDMAEAAITQQGFTVQFGVYAKQTDAVLRLDAIKAKLDGLAFPPARITEAHTSDGRTIFMVHAGSYLRHAVAAQAATQSGIEGARVALWQTNN